MLLNLNEFQRKAVHIAELKHGHIGADVETNGLNPHGTAKAFLLGFTDENGDKFSTFITPEHTPAIRVFASNPRIKYCCHNIKFEMGFFERQFQAPLQGILWCTEAMARVAYDKPIDDRTKFGLQACAQRVGLSKHEPMLEWLKKNKKQYHLAPKEIIVPYVEQDAWLSWELARMQMAQFRHWDNSSDVSIRKVVKLELDVVRPLYEMEKFGILTNVNYCGRALAHEKEEIEKAKKDFEQVSGVPFVDSRNTLAPVFDRAGVTYGKTEKGNASFTEENISQGRGNAVVDGLLKYRSAQKRASSYWENFLELEHNGIIHPSINQNRARTGRMSISDPSAQNWPTDEQDDEAPEIQWPVRRAFIAHEDCKIVSLDWSGVELRLMVDEAEDMPMINAIKTGKDFHQETADMAEVRRSLAKNGRFAKLYGAGVPRVATTLGVPLDVAQRICDAIDATSRGVTAYVRGLIQYVRKAPFGFNALGRRYYFDKGFEYKFPNYRIQGLCGELLKRSIIAVHKLLAEKAKSELTRMIVPIHDEIVLNMHKDDLHLIAEIRQIMIHSYDDLKKHLELDVGVFIGDNFYDLEEYKA